MLSNKCSHTIGVVNKSKHYLPSAMKIILYNDIFSHLNYCILVYGFQCGRLQNLQKSNRFNKFK